jgi:predicted MFS family arabinose efflux permease
VLRPAFLSDLRSHVKGSLGLYYLATLVLFFAMALGFVPFPIFLTDVLGATSTQVFFVFLIKAATDAAFYVPMGRLVRRRNGVELLSLASAVRVGILGAYALAAVLWPGPHSLVPVSLIFMLTGVTWAAIAVAGTTAVAVLAQKGLEGRAMGLYNAVLGLGWIVGSLAGGWCAGTFGYGASFGSAAILMAMMAVWFWRLRMRMPNQT